MLRARNSRALVRTILIIWIGFFIAASVAYIPLPSVSPTKTAQALAVAEGDGLLIYGLSGNTTPQWRTYDGTANSFGNATATVAGATGLNFIVRTSPTKQEAIAGYVNSSGTLQVMCYNGTSWTNEWTVSVGGTGDTRRFDIAYESQSGDVMVVYSTNAATTNELAYRTKLSSTGCGSANWAAAVNIDAQRTSKIVQWVQLASQFNSSSNKIALAWLDADGILSAMGWTGSSWAIAEPSSAFNTLALEFLTTTGNMESFGIAVESISGNIMVVWSINGTTCTANSTTESATCARYRQYTSSWQSVTTVPTVADRMTNLAIAANYSSDEIVIAGTDDNQQDLSLAYWSGSAWTGKANQDTTTATPVAGTKLLAAGWLVAGGTTRSVITYNDASATNIGWVVGDGGTFTTQSDVTPSPAFGNPQRWYNIAVDPINKDRLMFTLSDTNGALFSKRLIMTSAPAFTWTNSDGASLGTLAQSTTSPFAFDYWRFIPPTFNQSAYRFFNNEDSLAVITPRGDQDTPVATATLATEFRLRMTIHVSLNILAQGGENFKLQFARKGSGTCESPEFAYADLTTSSTGIAYHDNPGGGVDDGAALEVNASDDPAHNGHTVVAQTYEETNGFTNSIAAILAGQDGLWDFSLKWNNPASNSTYCIKAVKSDGSALNSYDVYPEISTPGDYTLNQLSYRWRNDDGAESGPATPETGQTIYLHPTGQGTDTGLTVGSGCTDNTTEWDCVNDQEDNAGTGTPSESDTTSSFLNGLGAQKSSFTLDDNTIPSSATVTSLEIFMRARETSNAGTGPNFREYYILNGVTVGCATYHDHEGTTYTLYSCSFTGLSLSAADLDNLEIGVENTANDLSVTQVYVLVTYDIPAQATWRENTNTAHTDQNRNENVRLRVLVKNDGPDSTGAIAFRLQYAQKSGSCAASTFLPVPNSDADVVMSTSSHFSDQDATTNVSGGISDPSGTFVTGRMAATPNNAAFNIDLAASEFTELEYVFQFTDQAAGTYCFQVAKSNEAFSGSYNYAEITLLTTVTVSGTVYSNETGTVINCSTSNHTIAFKVNGTGSQSVTCTAAGGTWSKALTGINENDILTVFIDGHGSNRGTIVTKIGSSNITGVSLIKDRVIVRNDSGSGSLINADLIKICSGGCDNTDTDIQFTASGNNITLSTGTELIVWTGATFAPGANVSTPKLEVQGTYSGSGETLTITGSGTFSSCSSPSSTPLCVNSGTFTAPTLIVYNAASSLSVACSGVTYIGLSLIPSSGIPPTYTLCTNPGQTLRVDGTFTIGSGTNIMVSANTNNPSLDLRGNLVINSDSSYIKSSGTITFKKGSSQTFTDNTTSKQDVGAVQISSNETNTTLNLGSSVKVTSLTINSGQTFSLNGGNTMELTGSGNPFVINGTFTHSTGFVRYVGTTANITATTYHDLLLGGTGTYTLPNTNTTLRGNLSITSGATVNKGSGTLIFAKGDTQTFTDNTASKQDLGAVQISANGTNTDLALLTDVKVTSMTIDPDQALFFDGGNTLELTGNDTPFVINGIFDHSTSTVQYTGATVNITATTYHNLTLGGAGTYTLPDTNITLRGNLSIASWATVNKGVGTIVFASGSDQQVFIDNTPSKQDVGAVQISANDTNTTLILFHVKVTSMTIDPDQTVTLNFIGFAGSLTLTGTGTPLVNNGNFDALSIASTNVYFVGDGDVTIPNLGYYHLTLSPTLTANRTYTAAGALNIAENLIINPQSDGAWNLKLNLGGAVDIGQGLTISGSGAATSTLDTLSHGLTTTAVGIQTPGTLKANNSTITIREWSNGGTFTADTSTVVVEGGGYTVQITGNTTFYNFTSTVPGDSLVFEEGHVYTFAHFIVQGTEEDPITISSSSGEQWIAHFINEQPVGNVVYVNLNNAGCNTGTAIVNLNSTNIFGDDNDESCWVMVLESIIISGTLSDSLGALDCSASGRTVAIKVNGLGDVQTSCTLEAGTFSQAVSVNANDILTVYISGHSDKGVFITKVLDNSSSFTADIFLNRIVIDNRAAGSVTNDDLRKICSSGCLNTDSDIAFSIGTSPYPLTISSGYELYVASGVTYAPGANITTPKLIVDGTYSAGSSTLTLTGAGTPLSVSGTFAPSTGTVAFAGDGAVSIPNLNYNNLTLNPLITGNRTYTAAGVLSVGGNLAINPDAASGLNLKLNLGGAASISGGITIQATNSATSTLDTTGSNHSVSAGSINIDTASELAANASTITLSGNTTPFVIDGTFTPSASTVQYTGATSNITDTTYHNLTLGGTGTYTLPDTNITLQGNLSIASGATVTKGSGTLIFAKGDTQTFTDNTASKQDLGAVQVSANSTNTTLNLNSSAKLTSLSIDVSQVFSLNGSNILTLTGNGSPLVISGTFDTPSGSTVAFVPTGTSGVNIPLSNYHNLVLNRASNVFIPEAGSLNIGGNLNVTAGILDLNSNDPTVTIIGDLIFAGTLQASDTNPLTVRGHWTDNGTFSHNNGTIIFDPLAQTVNIAGSANNKTFYNLTASAPGKILQFKNFGVSGDAFIIEGLLTLTGESGNPLRVTSTGGPGAQWRINVTSGSSSVLHLALRDSACAVGSKDITMGSTGVDLGNNGACWRFLVVGGGDFIGTPSGGGSPRSGGGSGGGSVLPPPEDEGGSGGGQQQGGGGSGGGGGGGGAP